MGGGDVAGILVGNHTSVIWIGLWRIEIVTLNPHPPEINQPTCGNHPGYIWGMGFLM